MLATVEPCSQPDRVALLTLPATARLVRVGRCFRLAQRERQRTGNIASRAASYVVAGRAGWRRPLVMNIARRRLSSAVAFRSRDTASDQVTAAANGCWPWNDFRFASLNRFVHASPATAFPESFASVPVFAESRRHIHIRPNPSWRRDRPRVGLHACEFSDGVYQRNKNDHIHHHP